MDSSALMVVSPIRCLHIDSNVVVADSVVKVPQMAESISEGTLKQFSKRLSPPQPDEFEAVPI